MAEKKQQMDLFAHFVYKVYSVLDMLENSKLAQTQSLPSRISSISEPDDNQLSSI